MWTTVAAEQCFCIKSTIFRVKKAVFIGVLKTWEKNKMQQ